LASRGRDFDLKIKSAVCGLLKQKYNSMTKAVYQSMFVSLSALLMAVLFVLQPSPSPEMQEFKSQIHEQFAQAAMELIAGESFVEPFTLVWNSVNGFYSESADQAVALLDDDIIASLALIFNEEYQNNVAIVSAPMSARVLALEEPLLNIIPMGEAESLLDPYFSEDLAYIEHYGGVVAGESTDANHDAEPPVAWMTINDSITTFPYCVAIFNGTINSYPGGCASDANNHLTPVYEN
jgi:hypothetical protein